ncbi:hypothetical protein A8C56_06395 [Niabella ginsenosidivorans]|uniref:Toxin SymE-like domain-containing protein n=1 Tax=Niabella ginsenosidivorans TaxID=1176587 RepID=A0A1A9HZ28_9BACT|nr:SymE family type I addiction module toxin [Niabella ginsenosidivorans]ANH80657.1 hypothetical protein A8C56_06395 [Niabella ginsenosidivorans]
MKNNQRKIRTLKVYEKAIIYYLTGYNNSATAHYPEIRLMGKWLTTGGFEAGRYVDVAIEPNKLTITLNNSFNKEAALKTTGHEK